MYVNADTIKLGDIVMSPKFVEGHYDTKWVEIDGKNELVLADEDPKKMIVNAAESGGPIWQCKRDKASQDLWRKYITQSVSWCYLTREQRQEQEKLKEAGGETKVNTDATDISRVTAKFVVRKLEMTGGTEPNDRDPWPDGLHVWVQRLNDDNTINLQGERLLFTMSGCFRGMIDKVNKVGRIDVSNRVHISDSEIVNEPYIPTPAYDPEPCH